MPTITLADIRGGLNNADPQFSIPDDQVVEMENIDITRATLGGRRLGHSSLATLGGTLDNMVFMTRHLPTSDETAAQLWTISTDGTTTAHWVRGDTTQTNKTPTGNMALDVAVGQYAMRAQTAHGKLFFAYPTTGNTDRLHVYDGTSIRKAGLAEPAAPTVANTGAGTYATLRYFRVRYTEQISSVTVRRSEPSTSQSFTPSGTGASARVTKPATISEGETHWEVEESLDDVNFYRIATVAVGTTTYDDSLTPAQVTADETLLSEDIGDYSLQYNPKFLSMDQDRLLMGGAWEQPALASRLSWTPVYGAPGVGNDERLEDDTDPFLDLDGFDGGALTDLAGPMFGYHLAYKRKRIYKILRTRSRDKAYEAVPYLDTIGALTRSVVKGVDEQGQPCQYFLDADYGPMRVGVRGVERLGADIHSTWHRVNLDAALVCHGLFDPDTNLVWWYLAVDADTTPSIRIRADISQFRPGVDGVRRGWMLDTGKYTDALCTVLFADNYTASVIGGGAQSLHLKPLLGRTEAGANLAECESTNSDNGHAYRSYFVTKPNLLGGLMQKGEVQSGVLTAEASEADVRVTLIRDYGLERKEFVVSVRPSPVGESHVIRHIDDCEIAEVQALQVEIGDAFVSSDVTTHEIDWTLDALALRVQPEESL